MPSRQAAKSFFAGGYRRLRDSNDRQALSAHNRHQVLGKYSMANKKKNKLLVSIAKNLVGNQKLLGLVKHSYNKSVRNKLMSEIHKQHPQSLVINELELYDGIFDVVSKTINILPLLAPLHEVMLQCKEGKTEQRRLHNNLVWTLGLDLKPAQRDEKLSYLEKVSVSQLSSPYPPINHWIYESANIHDIWHQKLQHDKQHDGRLARHPMHLLQPQMLQLNVEADRSMIIHDAMTGEIIGLIWRNFAPQNDVVDWVDSIVLEGCKVKRSIRLDDPGDIVQVGYSGGLRSKPAFDWSKNLKSRKHSIESLKSFDYSCSSVFALLWNMCTHRLPSPIVDDYIDFLSSTEIPRMDSNQKGEGTGTGYTINLGGNLVEFVCAEQAPPVGFFGLNYARSTHRESAPHKYGIFWNTYRSFGKDEGGNFFIANYGIRIEGANNTLVVWQPKHWHGTTLSTKDPHDCDLTNRQSGLSLITPSRLPGIWRKYRDGHMSGRQAHEALEEEDIVGE